MASAPAMGRTAAVLAASGSFAAAGLLAQYHKGDASLMPVAAALALADPGAGGSWAARALAVAHGVAGGVAQAVCPRVALAAALVVPDAVVGAVIGGLAGGGGWETDRPARGTCVGAGRRPRPARPQAPARLGL